MTLHISLKQISKTFYIPHEKKETLREYILSGFKGNTKSVFEALKNVSVDINKGEFVGIVGENGSGKSTLLKTIAGILRPDKGGERIIHGRISPFLELGVGFNPELSARENVYLNATILGLTKKQTDAVFDEIIAFAELEEFVDQKLKYFSSGMQVRLAFSVAIRADADILLLDEVLAVGDMKFQQKCFDIFRQLKKQQKTIIFVSHDLGSMRQFCTRVIAMRDGEIVDDGEANTVIDRYLYGSTVEELEEVTENQEEQIHEQHKVAFVEQVSFYTQGKKVSHVMPGEDVRMKVDYEVEGEVSDLVFGIALYHDTGAHLYGVNTLMQQIVPPSTKGKHTIYVDIPSLAIMKGAVFVTVALHKADGDNYDWKDKAYSFVVTDRGVGDGMMDMHASFTL